MRTFPEPDPKQPGALLFSERKDAFPIVLHADDVPAVLLCFVVERLGESSDLGVRQPLRGLCQSNRGRLRAARHARPQTAIYATSARHSANAAERLCL